MNRKHLASMSPAEIGRVLQRMDYFRPRLTLIAAAVRMALRG